MTGSRLDDPRYDPTAADFHLARDVSVEVNGAELRDLSDAVDEAIADLMALPDEEALGSDLVGVTTALLALQEFLRRLRAKFDAAGTPR